MGERSEKTPAEFTREMGEGDDGAGPGAPETVEPTGGRPGDKGEGPHGPGGAAMEKPTEPPDAES